MPVETPVPAREQLEAKFDKPTQKVQKEFPKEIKKTETLIKNIEIDNNQTKIKEEEEESVIPAVNPKPAKKLKWYQKLFNWFK